MTELDAICLFVGLEAGSEVPEVMLRLLDRLAVWSHKCGENVLASAAIGHYVDRLQYVSERVLLSADLFSKISQISSINLEFMIVDMLKVANVLFENWHAADAAILLTDILELVHHAQPQLASRVCSAVAMCLAAAGDVSNASDYANRAWDLANVMQGDAGLRSRASALHALGMVALRYGEFELARAKLENAETLRTMFSGPVIHRARTWLELAEVYKSEGQYKRATGLACRALGVCSSLGSISADNDLGMATVTIAKACRQLLDPDSLRAVPRTALISAVDDAIQLVAAALPTTVLQELLGLFDDARVKN